MVLFSEAILESEPFVLFVILVISHVGFESKTLVLIAPVPGHFVPFSENTRKCFIDKGLILTRLLLHLISNTY